MGLTEQQIVEFKKTSEPLINWLRENMHPHAIVIVDNERAELFEGYCVHKPEPQGKAE